jgi:hypothetical protein
MSKASPLLTDAELSKLMVCTCCRDNAAPFLKRAVDRKF